MAGNPRTPKSTAPASAQTKPGSKGVMVGMNKGKGVVSSTAITSKAMTKYKMGGTMKKMKKK
jgi:hypothetical protein